MEREKRSYIPKALRNCKKILELHKTVKKINITKVTFIFQ